MASQKAVCHDAFATLPQAHLTVKAGSQSKSLQQLQTDSILSLLNLNAPPPTVPVEKTALPGMQTTIQLAHLLKS